MVTANSNAFRRILAWMNERYPPGILLLHILMYFAPITIAMAINPHGAITYQMPRDILGPITFYCFPLILRIMDEHKDYAQDCLAHPNRILQSGIVKLNELKILAYGAALFQFIFCIWVDGGLGPATICWAVLMAYSLLMAKEFFCGEWLEKRMMAYAISHQAIMPISTFWIGAIALSPHWPHETDFIHFCLLTLLCSFGYEISRKIKAPNAEKEHVDSYTKAIGVIAASLMAIFLIGAQSAFTAWWLINTKIGATSLGWHIANVLITFIAITPAILFMTTKKTLWAKSMEASAAIMLLWVYGWSMTGALIGREATWM